MERFFLSHGDELGGRAGTRLLGFGDLGRLLKGHLAALEGLAELAGATHDLSGRDRVFGPGYRRPGDLGDLVGVVDPPGQGRDPVVDAPPRPGVDLQTRLRLGQGHELRLEVGIGLVQRFDSNVQEVDFHAVIMVRGYDEKRPESDLLREKDETFLVLNGGPSKVDAQTATLACPSLCKSRAKETRKNARPGHHRHI